MNFDKTEVLQHPNTPPIVIHFADGTPVTTVDKVKYLGTTLAGPTPLSKLLKHECKKLILRT